MTSTELRTLKDLPQMIREDGTIDFVDYKSLKQEAIKWVRFLKKYWLDGHYRLQTEGKIEMLKIFFNITEEELK